MTGRWCLTAIACGAGSARSDDGVDAGEVCFGGQRTRGEGQTAQAQHVVVHLRKDGSAERAEGDGDVTLTKAQGEA